ncbi:peptide/nickel transport system substrate-binding protein [Actinophytocola oryzae]|uniref:Peptide/nickel transport system substrate-binding protein n=2 Tax=Actinophytocola oryzae TaxID=502181 RepID=A0A4R7VYP0_9PSEU|nr:peptide/nickel transport system substrate-binding protein [Actinophytocola oryzae]
MTLVALGATACGGSTTSGTGTGNGSGSGQGANVNATGSPTRGGTLRVIGNADVDHLDTASAYYTTSYSLERTFTRQLYSYPASTDKNKALEPAPDVATELPTKSNGGISSDGRTITVHLRDGVRWNTTPARQVTAADFVLGFKRLCNPTQNSVGAPGYFEDTIAGMKDYCAAFASVPQNVAAFMDFMTSHDISGIQAVDDTTLRFTLTKPAGDFVNILALPFSSAAPVEYLNYMPDDADFRQHTLSDGPYAITKYVPGQSYVLGRNPAWQQSSDPLRHQYPNGIQVTLGADENAVQQQIAAGTQDLEWDTTVPTADVPTLKAGSDARLGIYPNYDSNPFLVFNEQSPNNSGALGKVAVRQALEYAVDKVALGQIYGGTTLNTPLDQVIPPGNVGYRAIDPYRTTGSRGDPAKCKSMLAAAGYPNGLTLTDVYRTSGKHPDVYQSVQADFKKCGVTIVGKPAAASDYYGKYLSDPTAAKSGVWDVSEPGWVPDWYGNNGRAIVEPLFDGRTYGPGSTDWGDYDNARVNADIDKALSTTDSSQAASALHDADTQIMKDAALIPFQTQSTPLMRSERVHNAVFWPFSTEYDYSNVWLDPAS